MTSATKIWARVYNGVKRPHKYEGSREGEGTIYDITILTCS